MPDVSTTDNFFIIYSKDNSKNMNLNASNCVSIIDASSSVYIRICTSMSVCLSYCVVPHIETHNIQIGRGAEADKMIMLVGH